ncbi:MAG: DegT/DnrJ/EryC1/StrS family aminotransferase [Elusimicrobiota bacterium]
MIREKIPISIPDLSRKEESAVVNVIRSKWISQGKLVEHFEQMIKEFVGAKYALAVNSCTSALHISLLSLGINDWDEVIVPSFTFIATVNSVVNAKATPVFVDIDLNTYNIDHTKIEKTITKKTKAIMPVHQIGLPAEMEHISKIAKKYNLHIIEDAACALGTEYHGMKIGSISELTCFSFHPRKIITTGEGGMITTNNKDIYEKLISLRSHGISTSGKYNIAGFNYRMTDIQAAIGIQQMKKIRHLIDRRIELARRYNESLNKIEYIITPYIPENVKHIYQSYIIRIKQNSPKARDELMKELQKKGIATRKILAAHLEPYYQKKIGEKKLPVTELCNKDTLLLPIYPSMSLKKQDYIIENIRKFLC